MKIVKTNIAGETPEDGLWRDGPVHLEHALCADFLLFSGVEMKLLCRIPKHGGLLLGFGLLLVAFIVLQIHLGEKYTLTLTLLIYVANTTLVIPFLLKSTSIEVSS